MHNGVFRRALNSVFGSKLNITGGKYMNYYTTKIPASWNWKNLRVVAFISRPMRNAATGFTDMYVNNAEVFKFKEGTDVQEILIDENAVPVEYYDIMGHRLNEPQHGLNIVKMSNGTAKKVFVR